MIVAGRRRLTGAREVFLQRMQDTAPELKAAAALGLLRLGRDDANQARSALSSLLESDSNTEVVAALSKLDGDYGLIDSDRFEKLASSTSAVIRDAALLYANKWLFRVLSGRRSQIEFPTVEVDGVDEVLLIAETARRGLDPLNP